jgi:hypothetical protein
MQQIGLPTVMSIRKVFSTIGVIGRNCIQEYRNNHYVVTPEDVIVHDGRTAKSIATKMVRRWLGDNVQSVRVDEVYTAWNHKNNSLYVAVPNGVKDYCETALVFDGDGWGMVDIGEANQTNATGDEGFPHMFSAFYENFVVRQDRDFYGINPDSTADDDRVLTLSPATDRQLTGRVELTGVALNKGQAAKVTRIWPIGTNLHKVAGANDCKVTLGVHNHPDESVNWGTAQTWGASGATDPVTVSGAGRYHAIRFDFASEAIKARLAGFDLEWAKGGSW